MTGEDFDGKFINIWVHLHKSPFELRKEEFAKKLAQRAGRVSSNNIGYDGGEYVKVRMKIDTTKPVLSGLFIKRANRKPAWIPFKMLTERCLKAEEREKFTPEWKDNMEDDRLLAVSPP